MDSIYRHVLTDTERNLWYGSWALDELALPLRTGSAWHVRKTTLKGGLQDGVDLIRVDNGALSFYIVPTRGMGIWKGVYKGIPLGWDSPVRDPVHPGFVDLNDRGGLGWLKGFNEWIVRCGLESNGGPCKDTIVDNNGNRSEVALTLHGKVANIPARFVEVRVELSPPHRITVLGIVEESMMFGPSLRLTSAITTSLGSNMLTIQDEVTNLNRTPAELELLYHCNYGPPILEKGSSLVAPFKAVYPRDAVAREEIKAHNRFSGPVRGFVEQCYSYQLAGKRESGETCVLLKNREGNLGSSLQFSLKQMPCFTLWKNTAPIEDGYVTGLEPATNYPNPKWFERQQGRVVSLEGGETRRMDLTLAVHDRKQRVKEVEGEIRKIQKRVRPKVFTEISKRLSAVG